MRVFWKEIVILLVQLFAFYILPLFAGPTSAIGMVLLLLILTFALSLTIASISKEKVKYFYPLVVAVLFLPSVFIYYNSSALIHALWYFIISLVGVLIGTVIYKIINK